MKLSKEQAGNLLLELSRLMDSGMTLGDSLALLAEDAASPIKEKLEKMAVSADWGNALHDIAKDSRLFTGDIYTLLEAASASGRTDRALKSIGDRLLKNDRMMKNIKMSLVYPCTLLAVLLGVTVILLVWVLPVFEGVYASFGGVSAGIGVLLKIGGALRLALPWIGLVLLALGAVWLIPALRERIKRAYLSKYGDRGHRQKANSADFVSALSMAISSGMTEEHALDIAYRVSSSRCREFKARCKGVSRLVSDGESLARALKAHKFITAADVSRLEIGKRSGHGEEALARLSDELYRRSEEAISKRLSVIEPTIVGVSCLIIGGILLAVMLPLINIMNGFG